eukprot:TRINITY_DN1372_c0_g1_i1.p1 TRINITY_DN1372_c0_g1~~TRINITY_DN1372_c0_g1_i1.p1  ORF type:complete len:492 (-),score=163.50 TRINITY_DN1372_c0_g1_i1:36-1511(-)
MSNDDFFLSPTKKRGRQSLNGKNNNQKNKKRKLNNYNEKKEDEILSDDSDLDSDNYESDIEEEEDEYKFESLDERRYRLSKQYLDAMKQDEEDDVSSDEEYGNISRKLKREADEAEGRYMREVANKFSIDTENIKIYKKGHKLPPTCICISNSGKFIYTASKDCSIIQWNVETGEKIINMCYKKKKKNKNNREGHSKRIISIAISNDDKILATGGEDKMINLWNAEDISFRYRFKGHKNSVSGLAFQKTDSSQLYSCSHDRVVKVWNATSQAYIDTLFGHQTPSEAIDCLKKERPITVGGDRTCRIWKIEAQSQLVFKGHHKSIDCISMINEEHFITGSQDGSISLWHINKKKPIYTVSKAHKSIVEKKKENEDFEIDSEEEEEEEEEVNKIEYNEHWITSLGALVYSDIFASGSNDGFLKFWSISDQKITLINSIPISGFINGIKFSKNGDFVAVVVGQEHRLGRWWREKKAKNSLYIIPISINDDNNNG